MVTKIAEQKKKYKFKIKPEEMMAQGVHLGHRTSKLHPKMESFILGIRNTVHVIDLEKTAQCLEEALSFIEELIKKGGRLLLVGTKPPLKKLVKEVAEDCGLPYVVERWLGGTFTNFGVIKKRIDYFKEMEEKEKKGEFDKYTKKEKIKIEKELQDLKRKFEGLKNLEEIPQAIFICDLNQDKLAQKEAKKKGVKVVAICDTNTDPSLADYPIPANDDALSSVKYILGKVKEVIVKSKK